MRRNHGNGGGRHNQQCTAHDRSHSIASPQGHFTTSFGAYSAPIVREGSRWSAPSMLSFCDSAASICCGVTTESLQWLGAPTSLPGFFSAKVKSTKNSLS